MKGKFDNSISLNMIIISSAITIVGFAVFGILFAPFTAKMNATGVLVAKLIMGVMAEVALILTVWFLYLRRLFSYNTKARLPERINEFISSQITVNDGKILDIGCGSGSLTLTCGKAHPRAYVVGVDTYTGSKKDKMYKCKNNRAQNKLSNVTFRNGSIDNLRSADEAFDAIISNYVFTRESVKDRKLLLKEAFRVLKKGGEFALHDIYSKANYGDMNNFMEELRVEGFQEVELVATTKGNPITPLEANFALINKSFLLRGIK